MSADYSATYWAVIKLREDILNGSIRIPYARNRTIQTLADLLQGTINAAFKR